MTAAVDNVSNENYGFFLNGEWIQSTAKPFITLSDLFFRTSHRKSEFVDTVNEGIPGLSAEFETRIWLLPPGTRDT